MTTEWHMEPLSITYFHLQQKSYTNNRMSSDAGASSILHIYLLYYVYDSIEVKVALFPIIIALLTEFFRKWQVITLWIVTAMRIMVIQNGKTDKTVLVLEFWFFKHLVKELGYMRRWIAKCSTA